LKEEQRIVIDHRGRPLTSSGGSGYFKVSLPSQPDALYRKCT